MNQPPGGGYPPGPQYPGQPGFPPQGAPQQPQVGQPGAAKPFQGTQLMPGAPALPGQMNAVQQAQAQAAAALAQQQAGGPPNMGAPGMGAPGMGAPMGPPMGAPGMPPQQGYPGAPPQGYSGAPGMPQQGAPQQGAPQQQGGLGGMNIGVGGFSGGMPNLQFGGALSRGNLVAKIIGGQGFDKPRLTGAMLIGISFLFGIINTVLVLVLHRYYMYLYSAGAIFGWCGTWMLITGQPKAQPDGSKAPGWGRVGMFVCLGIGVLVGAALNFFNWEHMLVDAAVNQ